MIYKKYRISLNVEKKLLLLLFLKFNEKFFKSSECIKYVTKEYQNFQPLQRTFIFLKLNKLLSIIVFHILNGQSLSKKKVLGGSNLSRLNMSETQNLPDTQGAISISVSCQSYLGFSVLKISIYLRISSTLKLVRHGNEHLFYFILFFDTELPPKNHQNS